MTIRFGLELDEQIYPLENEGDFPVEYYCGERNLLQFLEKQTGLSYPNADEYLRIEQYRQLLGAYLQRNPDAFYRASLDADALATAAALLERRDELLICGWNFSINEQTPARLKAFAKLEKLLQSGEVLQLGVGKAERWRNIIDHTDLALLPFQKIYLNEPLRLLPPYLQTFFNKIKEYNIDIIELPAQIQAGDTNLGRWQNALLHPQQQKALAALPVLENDHSIVILKAQRETNLAAYLAKIKAANPSQFSPLCLIPNQNRALDNALIQEGIPSLGILSASLARPTLQILKLVSAFLCNPIDPYKILEFLSLPNRPLHDELAKKIAEAIAEKPGFYSNVLVARVHEFFEKFIPEKIKDPKNKKSEKDLREELKETRETYEFLFQRRRYDSQHPIPKSEIISVFRFLHIWSMRRIEELHKEITNLEKNIKEKSLLQIEEIQKLKKIREEKQNILKPIMALNQQANRVWQIVEALPDGETHLTFLQLERLIRTISEAAPIRFRQPEQGHLPYIYAPSAITQPAETVLWWNFIQSNSAPLFARWYAGEVGYLADLGAVLDSPAQENERRLWQNMQPVLQAKRRLILVLPASVDGKEAAPHALWSDLQAFFKESVLDACTLNVDKPQTLPDWWKKLYAAPPLVEIASRRLEDPPIETSIPNLEALLQREEETFTSLESLLYTPHRWVFQFLMKLRHSSILNVVGLDALKGNLAHGAFEFLFEHMKSNNNLGRIEVEGLMETKANEMMRNEGVVLLMYGKEPERMAFTNKLKMAAWALVEMIQNNDWKIAGVEMPIEGKLDNIILKGTADLVLERNGGKQKAILDLKWGGAARRKADIKNNHDLQLVIYSYLLGDNGANWADTGFFIIENAKAIARNRRAFKEAHVEQTVDDTATLYQGIWNKIKATYRWRMEQLQQGKIEIRTEENYEKVEEHTQFELAEKAMLLLEMRKDKMKYDRYKPLIGKLK